MCRVVSRLVLGMIWQLCNIALYFLGYFARFSNAFAKQSSFEMTQHLHRPHEHYMFFGVLESFISLQ